MGVAAILVMWPKYFVQILLIIGSLHMKFDVNWANGLWEIYVLIYWWDSHMSDLAERSKVNLDLWNLFIAIVSLG